ncbi:site-specific integrase [Chitinophaga sancti]|uniref:site-specific integrase n=1 Tax=Chitinophaga sancti TaxID=1004 RepID=UPI002A74E86D|nr:site-specific integrase [Chitinophaga sancti]WPQ63709.1 site-specific integrase [Chitinophaga sancti]
MEGNRIFITYFLYKSRKTSKGQIPIFVRITYEGNRLNHNTALFIEEKSWDGRKYQVKGNKQEAQEINKNLSILKGRILSIYNDLLERNIPVSIDLIRNKLAGKDIERKTLLDAVSYHNEQLSKSIGIDHSKGTLTKFKTLEAKLVKFITTQLNRKDIFLKELKHEFVVDFEMYLKRSEKISHNPVIKYIQSLKKVINMAITHGWLDNNPFRNFKCSLKTIERGYLSQEELLNIQHKVIENERLNKVRDIFIFSCFTGLAYADIKELKYKHLSTINNERWIITHRQKTNTRTSIPLLPQAVEVLNNYEDMSELVDANIFPVLSNQKMNAYLKEIGDICKVNKNLTFHLARHTFATTVTLTNGVPIETVSKMLGHTNLKTTQIYAKVVDTKVSDDMQVLRRKLLGVSKSQINE